MQLILGKMSPREEIKAFGLRGAFLLAALLGMGVAQADTTTNFTGDFAPALWTNSPAGVGSVYFTNSSAELVLSGPNKPSAETLSIDPIIYSGPAGSGLAVAGTVEFNWAYDSNDALSTSEADFAWVLPGAGSPTITVLASGGPGTTASGSILTPELAAGTIFEFLLTTDTPTGKPSGTLVITDFQFHPNIPEPSTSALFTGALLCLGAARSWHNRRQSFGQ